MRRELQPIEIEKTSDVIEKAGLRATSGPIRKTSGQETANRINAFTQTF